MNLPEARLGELLKVLPALRNPTVSHLANREWVAVETIIDEKVVREIIPLLKGLGAEGIIEYPLNKLVYSVNRAFSVSLICPDLCNIQTNMKYAILVITLLAQCVRCLAQESTIHLQYPKSEVWSVLSMYERFSGKPVFARLDLNALVTIETDKPIPRAAALELIRSTLLERYGIELRETPQGEILAGWSKDPKYPRRSDEPATEEERRAASPKGRVRILRESK